MIFTSKFLQKVATVTIRHLKREEFEQVLDIAYQVFSPKIRESEEEFKNTVREELGNRISHCYVAEVDGRIVGGYLLARSKNFQGLKELDSEIREKGIDLNGKVGVQGVALFLLPQYRNEGIGKQLREIPLSRLRVDYVWGEHLKELNNLPNWIGDGRTLIAEKDDCFITLKQLPRAERKTPEPKKPTPILVDELQGREGREDHRPSIDSVGPTGRFEE